jgi:hypothetical protein
MRVRTKDARRNGVRTRRYKYATRQHRNSREISAWLQRMYHMYVSPFYLKIGATKNLVETANRGIDCSAIRIELWRARIRTGCYQVNGQSLAACILIKEAHFLQL